MVKTKEITGCILRAFATRDRSVMLTLWKALVIPHFDYCSQLWSPSTINLIQELEVIQASFLKKIKGLTNMNYWDQLKVLNMYSLQRRRDRYRILYVWSILEKIVPNFNHNENGREVGGITYYNHIRHGRKCSLRTVERSYYRGVISESFSVQGPRLFNSLPKDVRNITGCSKEKFKSALDKFLCKIPDEPHIKNCHAVRHAESNNLVEQIKTFKSIGLYELDG